MGRPLGVGSDLGVGVALGVEVGVGVTVAVAVVLGVLPITLCWVSMKALASPLWDCSGKSVRLAKCKTYRGNVPESE